MILADKDLKRLAESENLIAPFHLDQLTNIGYDVTCKDFTNAVGKDFSTYELAPGESIFARAEEAISLPDDLAARVVLRNSRIRQGLSLEAPLYQPGHKTPVFFRISNISKAMITLHSGDGLATVVFEKLTSSVDSPYRGAFQEEFDYRGMGKYGAEYSEQIREIEEKITDLKHVERSLYGNVITIMTIFIGIFSLININVTAVSSATWELVQLIGYNLAIVGGISTLAGLIRVLVPTLSGDRQTKLPKWYWVIPVAAFAASVLLTLIP